MIIGYNFLGHKFHGNIFDTAISTAELDEVKMGAGLWDELFVSVDTKIGSEMQKPTGWQLKTIMDAKFQNSLEAGSLGADGHVVTKIQLYRRDINSTSEWLLIGMFDYDENYNVYSFVDRLAENLAVYEYAIVPVADTILGDRTVGKPVKVEYDGVFLSDLHNNYQVEFDIDHGAVNHNRNFAEIQTLNNRYPIAVYGKQNYRSSSLSFLPLSKEQIESRGTKINARTERELRQGIVDFMQSNGAKVIRNSNGDMTVIAAHNVVETPRKDFMEDLADISFDYIEIGKLDYETMSKGGLIGKAGLSNFTFDEDGDVIWNNGE